MKKIILIFFCLLLINFSFSKFGFEEKIDELSSNNKGKIDFSSNFLKNYNYFLKGLFSWIFLKDNKETIGNKESYA